MTSYPFDRIIAHKEVRRGDHDYQGSCYNVQVEWRNGLISWEKLSAVARSIPRAAADYAVQNDLVDTPGWKRLRSYTTSKHNKLRRSNNLRGMVNQARASRYWCGKSVTATGPNTSKTELTNKDDDPDLLTLDGDKEDLSSLAELLLYLWNSIVTPSQPQQP